MKNTKLLKRTCSKCGAIKPLNENYFSKNQSTNTGGNKYFRPECKVCSKSESKGKNIAVKRFMESKGLKTKEEYKQSRPLLGTACDNCGRTDKRLVFDHCHTTYAHRGWLCDNCNRSIGMLGDTIYGLERALKYLKKQP